MTTTRGDDGYTLQVARSGGIISFKVQGLDAEQTFPQWTMGSVETGFNLSAVSQTGSGCRDRGLRPPTYAEPDPTALTSQPPHIFTGMATVDGQAVRAGVLVTAWDGSVLVGRTRVKGNGGYTIAVGRSAGSIVFRIGQLTASRTHPWVMGSVETGFNLAASAAAECGGGPVEIDLLVSALGDNFVRAFSFDNNRKEWRFYDPRAGEANTLTQLVTRHAYFILVREDAEWRLNGRSGRLTCRGGNCWNVIVW